MKVRNELVMLLLAIGLAGCPASVDEQTNAATNNAATNNAATNNTTSTAGGTNNTVGLADVVVEFVPVEWGLFSGAASGGTSVEVAAAAAGEPASATVELGPGAFALRVQVGSSIVIDASATPADRLVPVHGDIASQPFFVSARSTIEIEIWSDPIRVEAQVVNDGTDLPTDAVASLTESGRWFDEGLGSIVGAADPGAATVELMNQIRQMGGPIFTEKGVLFIAPAQDGESPPQIRGTWNNFEADELSELHRVAPGLWARFVDVGAGRQTYKIYYPDGDAWVTDLSNPHIEWDGFNPNDVGSFNSVLGPQGARTVWLPAVASSQLQNERDVYVHLPSTYDGSAARFPSLYVHDGNESMVRSQLQIVADETGLADPTTEAVLIFVALPSQTVRLDEYVAGTVGALGNEYVDFLADTLVPLVDESFRTRPDRTARGLHGASLGGLISFWGAMQHPQVFGYTAGMSSSFDWGGDYVIAQIGVRGCQDVVYYLDSGPPTAMDNFDDTQRMRDTLDGLGCEYDYVVDPDGGHNWASWRGRFGGVLADFADEHGGVR